MIRKMILASLAIAALAVDIAPAWAIDLTGTWTDARSTCRQILPTGDVVKYKDDQVFFEDMKITHLGDGSMTAQQGIFNLRGGAYAKGSNPATGAEGFIEKCDSPFPDSQIGWKIKNARTFPPNSKGATGVMNVEFLDAVQSVFGNYVEFCQVRYERTSTTNPNIAACP